MKLIVRGAFQGKKAFAVKKLCISPDRFADGKDCAFEEIYERPAILHFHEYVRRMLEKGLDSSSLVDEVWRRNPEIVIVCSELGCGVVPTDAFDRTYRESVGRLCTHAAELSEEVYRVVCGIGMRIK